MATTKGNTRHTAVQKAEKSSASAKTKKQSTKRKYSPAAGEYVREEMEEMKQGKLKSGRSGQTVHNPKQAIAIGLSEARKAGAKVPSKPPRKAA
jgi:pyruvate/2-oxoglutarate dehydrogenase complex dihydrolipoamide acyltransferase (E2) component